MSADNKEYLNVISEAQEKLKKCVVPDMSWAMAA